MTPGKFLRLIWPDTGFYCIAHPFKPKGSSVTVYSHHVFDTISKAVTHVHEQKHLKDVYFAMLSLDAERVWDAEKTDYKTGQKGAWAVRKQENMAHSKVVFFDVDVGPEPEKYATQADALRALIDFCTAAKLPLPTLVSSGGGVHVYWHLDAAMPRLQWRELAWKMRQLASGLKFRVDPTRTIDVTSVLRVPDTLNWKDRQNPRPVQVLQEGSVTPVAAFERLAADALIANGIEAGPAPVGRAVNPALAHISHNLPTQEFRDFGAPPTLEEVGAACGQVREMVKAYTDPKHPNFRSLDNTAWYRGMLATVKHVEDGDDWCRKLTNLDPRTNADLDAKLAQLEQFPPARCETLQEYMPWKDAPCHGCKAFGNASIPNPLACARKTTPAPPPQPETPPPPPPPPSSDAPTYQPPLTTPSLLLQAATIPNPPWPFERLKTGEVAITNKDKDGNTTTKILLSHDLYPLRRLSNKVEGQEQQVWRTMLPRSGAHDFILPAATLYDGRALSSVLANNGVYPTKADISGLQDYMVAYIASLQTKADAEEQSTHLGWSEDYKRFLLPDKTLESDGSVKRSSLSEGAARSASHMGKAGDMATQVELLRFYEHPAYIPNQSVILDAFASVIFYATGHAGVVVNCSGDSGASKSTTLYAAASVWGHPTLWPINGTNRGATANARAQRIMVNANLPTMVDEITHILPRDAADMVMSITQPGHRLRLSQDGHEKATSTNHKSAIMIATANSSLHSLLSHDNTAGTASSMRVFEMQFRAQRVHTKAEADEFLRQLKLHYGHLGEMFVQFVSANRVAVENRVHTLMREIDDEGKILSAERYWSARIACILVAGEICKALGIIHYDISAIRRWALISQIPAMRGTVREEYRDSLAILQDYIAESHGGILVIGTSTAIGTNTAGQSSVGESSYSLNNVNGALRGHFETGAGVLYLHKQSFKEYCNRTGASSSRVLAELCEPYAQTGASPSPICIGKNTRRTLGKGTPHAKGQVYCVAIDMNHAEMSGAVPLASITGGASTSTPASGQAGLKIVK